jgi:hypothetical protein
MSEVYKTFPGGLYFVTFTTIGWIDIFPHWRKSSDLCHTIIQAAPSQQVLYYHNNPLHCCKHIIRDYKPILSAQDFHVCNLISVPAFLHHLIQ